MSHSAHKKKKREIAETEEDVEKGLRKRSRTGKAELGSDERETVATIEIGKDSEDNSEMVEFCLSYLQNYAGTKEYNDVLRKVGRYRSTENKKRKTVAKLPSNISSTEGKSKLENIKNAINDTGEEDTEAGSSKDENNEERRNCIVTLNPAHRLPQVNVAIAPKECLIPREGPPLRDMHEFFKQRNQMLAKKGEDSHTTKTLHFDGSVQGGAIPGPEDKGWGGSELGEIYEEWMAERLRYWDRIHMKDKNGECSKHVPDDITPDHVARMLVKPCKPFFSSCTMGRQCKMRKLKHPGGSFTGMAYISEEKYDYIMNNGTFERPDEGLCYICILSHYTQMWAENNAHHIAEKINTPFKFQHSKPGQYCKHAMIQQCRGYTDGITVPFRYFVTSDYVPCYRDVELPNGQKRLKVPAFKEKAELFFRRSSRDLEIPSVDPYAFYTIEFEPLTTGFLLRKMFNDAYSKLIIQSVLLKYVEDNFIDKDQYHAILGDKKSANRQSEGIMKRIFREDTMTHIKSRRSVDVQVVGRKTKKECEDTFLFGGRPFDYIFSDNMETTESKVKELCELFGYAQSVSRGYDNEIVIYRYPHFSMHEQDLENTDFPEEMVNICDYRRYHALMVRINVVLSILYRICSNAGITYTDLCDALDHKGDPHSKKRVSETFDSRVKFVDKMEKTESVKMDMIKKMNLFLSGNMKLVDFFNEHGGPIADEAFDLVPKRKVCLPEQVDEWRTVRQLTEPKIPEYFEKSDEKYTSYRIRLAEKKPPNEVIEDFYREKNIDVSLCICEFETSLRFIRSMSAHQLQTLYDMCKEFRHWNPGPFIVEQQDGRSVEMDTKSIFSDPDTLNRCRIFVTLIWRVNHAYTSIETLSNELSSAEKEFKKLQEEDDIVKKTKNKPKRYKALRRGIERYREVIYNLKLFICTHIELARHICDTHRILDQQLMQPVDDHSGESSVSDYIVYYPDNIRFFHEGDLPDMAKYYAYVNFIANNRTEGYTWFYLMAKSMPRCCQSRKWINKQEKACKSSDAYARWVKMCLRVSLTGMYRSCSSWPHFHMLLRVNKSLDRMMEDPDYFYNFQRRHAKIVMNALRENMFYQFGHNPPLLQVTQRYFPKWDRFKRVVQKKMDLIRSLMNEKQDLGQINDLISDIFANVRFVFRRNQSEFIVYIIGIFKEINTTLTNKARKRKGQERAWESSLSCSIFFQDRGAVINQKSRPPKLKKWEIDMIDGFVECMDPTQDIDLRQLKYIGISDEGIHLIDCAYNLFLEDEQNRSVATMLERMNVTDYERAFYFFSAFRTHSSLIVIESDYDMRVRQEQGVRWKYMINPSEQIPDASRAIVFTTCCQSVKTFVAQRDQIRFYGHEKVQYDEVRGYNICYGKKNKNNSKKRRRASKLEEGNNSSNSSGKAKKVPHDKNRYEKKCGEKEVIVIPGIGHIVQFDAMKEKPCPTSYTICPAPRCGSVTEFNLSMYGPNGFTCNKCDEKERKQLRMIQCDGCNNIPKNSTSLTSVYMLDDGYNGTYQMQRYYFCASCSRKCVVKRMGRDRNATDDTNNIVISRMESTAMLGQTIRTHNEFVRLIWNARGKPQQAARRPSSKPSKERIIMRQWKKTTPIFSN